MITRFFILTTVLFLSITASAQRYKRIHAKAVLIDTHNDIPSASIEKKMKFDDNLKGKTHSDLLRMKEGGVDVQLFSIFCGPEQLHPYAYANREMDSVYEWTRRNPGKMMIVKTPADLQHALKEKKLAAMMGVEGGHMIENKMENLEKLADRGMRYLTLTWNNSSSWATSAADETTKGDSLPFKGLTDFGKQVVKRMNELGVMIDVSHVGEKTFWDAINTSTKPVIASHSCVWNLCPHRRNLKDDQIKAIAKTGGVIFLNFYAGFIDSNYLKNADLFRIRHKAEIDSLISQNTQPDYARMMITQKYPGEVEASRPSISMLLDHLDYIVRLVGVDHVGLGSDFDGIEAPPKELNGVEDYPLITKGLLQRGYSKKEIRKILGENFLRVFKANLE